MTSVRPTTQILRYEPAPLDLQEWDAGTADVAARAAVLIRRHHPNLPVEHIGSSAVPGLPGKNVVDLSLDADPAEIPAISATLESLGFQLTTGPRAFPPTRPLFIGAMDHAGRRYRIHAHVEPRGHRVYGRGHQTDVAFRDVLRTDAALRSEYAARKREIAAAGVTDTYRYSLAKTEWIRGALERLGLAEPPILPPATLGILGGGQLGRMLAVAARQLGYRIRVLDPDPEAPATAVADATVVARYNDADGAQRMADGADLITLELEHVALGVVQALDLEWPVRPGVWAVHVTQNRLAERQFVESEGIEVAPWREVRGADDLSRAARDLGLPLRVKVATGGYDGRGQVRVDALDEVGAVFDLLRRPPGEPMVAERELDFECELSIVCARGVDGRAVTFPVGRNRHDEGILVESVVPAPVPEDVADRAREIVRQLAEGLDLVGTLTAELFLLRDGRLVVNELAPRVHNTGHWSIEACTTSQFEQHVRAITGLPLGSTALRVPAAATVNLLGEGRDRPARPTGLAQALAIPDVHVHLYDKRRVFERRKMGHVTAIGETAEEALHRARRAAAVIGWAETPDDDDDEAAR